MKCKTSRVLDEAFPDASEVGEFSISLSQRRMLQAQLADARHGNYAPLPGHTMAESLEACLPQDGADNLTFTPCEEQGWTSVRS